MSGIGSLSFFAAVAVTTRLLALLACRRFQSIRTAALFFHSSQTKFDFDSLRTRTAEANTVWSRADP